MKKAIAILLALLMVLPLAACGSGGQVAPTPEPTIALSPEPTPAPKLTKEELLEKAKEIDDFASAYAENKLRAEQKYIGNAYLVTGAVNKIEKDYIELCVDRYDDKRFTVDLPLEDIINLDVGQQITVVGIIESLSDTTKAETSMGNSWEYTQYNGSMINSYLVSDRCELTGTLVFYYQYVIDTLNNNKRTYHYGEADYWLFGLDLTDDKYITAEVDFSKSIPVQHTLGKDIDTVSISGQKLKNGTKIKVSGKYFGNRLEDIELIKVY